MYVCNVMLKVVMPCNLMMNKLNTYYNLFSCPVSTYIRIVLVLQVITV